MKQVFLTLILLSFLFSCNQKKTSEKKEIIETKTKALKVENSKEKNLMKSEIG